MKWINKLILTITLAFSSAALAAKSSAEIMKETSSLTGDYILDNTTLKNGVQFSEIKWAPKFSPALLTKIKQMEQRSAARYVEALESSEDLNCTLAEAREDIRLCLPEGAVQIGERYIAKLNGEVVGYALKLWDHGDAAIIQDGSWIVIYLDANMNIVEIYTGQS